jgi:hypothetical protein
LNTASGQTKHSKSAKVGSTISSMTSSKLIKKRSYSDRTNSGKIALAQCFRHCHRGKSLREPLYVVQTVTALRASVCLPVRKSTRKIASKNSNFFRWQPIGHATILTIFPHSTVFILLDHQSNLGRSKLSKGLQDKGEETAASCKKNTSSQTRAQQQPSHVFPCCCCSMHDQVDS